MILVVFRASADMTLEEKGWPNNAYGVSKLGVTLITPIQQKIIDPDGTRDIAVNSVSFQIIFIKHLLV